MERQTGVIIVAGGGGSRMGGARPKQFMLLGGMPILARTINNFAAALPGAEIVVVLPAEHTGFWHNLSGAFRSGAAHGRRRGPGAVPLGEKRIGGPETRSGADRRTGRRAAAGVAGADPAHGRGGRGTRHGDSGRRACGFVPRNGRARLRRSSTAAACASSRRRRYSAPNCCAAPTKRNTGPNSPTTLR